MSRSGAWRVQPVLVVAVVAALAGLVVNVWRPLAPPPLGVPTDLDVFAPAVLEQVAAYRTPQRLVAVLALLVSVAVPVAVAVNASLRSRLAALVAGRRPATAAAIVAVVVVVLTDLATVPTDVWLGWFHERAWGFAAGDLTLWIRDRAVGLLLRAGVVAVGAVLLVALVRRVAAWHLWLVVLSTLAAGLLVLLQPLVVQPLFLRTEPLPPGPTHEAVAQVLERAGEPGLAIEVGDASTRTTRVNAFVTGLGPSRRVVLYDTLLALPSEQVAYVVAHELAHREHRDLPRGVLLTASGALPVAWLLRRWYDRLSGGGRVDPAVLVLVALAVLTVANVVGAPVANLVSRRAEAAADHRALLLTEAPAVQVQLNRGFVDSDLADPTPPAWVTALWGTHPSVTQRIQAAVDHAARTGLPLAVPVDGES